MARAQTNLALWLTFLRIGLAPVFVLVFFRVPGWYGALFGLGIVLLSELTDMLDGHIARKMGTVTDFGKILDPLADSVFRLTIFLSFVSAGLAPLELVLLIFYRDAVLATIRTLCASRNVVVAARWSGKIKAVIQAGGIIAILLLHVLFYGQDIAWIAYSNLLIMIVITIITIASAVEYIIATWPILLEAVERKV